MDKARKKELLKAYADEQRQSFKDSLPMDEELFWQLFDIWADGFVHLYFESAFAV